MTTTHFATETADEISAEAVDRIVLAVDHAAMQAKRSQVRRDRASFRKWVLRRGRQVRFFAAWGL